MVSLLKTLSFMFWIAWTGATAWFTWDLHRTISNREALIGWLSFTAILYVGVTLLCFVLGTAKRK